jgi:asparagine synthase (glutamine-hydrolysing)
MCGIAGVMNRDGRPALRGCIRRMTQVLRHRGPDDEGYLLVAPESGKLIRAGGSDTPDEVYRSAFPYSPNVQIGQAVLDGAPFTIALGHRRLSIIDLSPAGHQPMCNRDGTLWIVYNGEVYNYQELRKELESCGCRFASNSDTEVVLAAYEHWGPPMLRRFVGMFAFAVLDLPKRRLLLGRDCFGIKPLYYTAWDGGFGFASEIKSLLELPTVGRQVDPQRLYEFLRFGLTDYGEGTLFASIRQVPAAHYLSISLEDRTPPDPVRYWDLDLTRSSNLSYREAANRAREEFSRNVQLHLRSDVPLGSALSGGVDSSSIVSVMRWMKQGDLDLHTFSFISSDPATSEEKWVEIVARSTGARLHKVYVKGEDLPEIMAELVYCQDEPFPSASILAQHEVFRAAGAAKVHVLLDGQGADEVLGGYPRFHELRAAGLLRRGHVLSALDLLHRTWKNNRISCSRLGAGTLRAALPSAFVRMAEKVAGMGPVPGWMHEAWFRDRGVSFKAPADDKRGGFKRALHETLVTTILPALLRFEDRNSMAFSVESRVPYLTPSFVEYMFSLPDEYILSDDGLTKAVFRTAMKGITSRDILERRDKIPFLAPEAQWLLSSRHWCERVLSSEKAGAVPAVDREAILNTWRSLNGGKRRFPRTIWRWISLVLWAERFSVEFP